MKLITSISGSLGSLLVVALLSCGILIAVIVTLTKKIGMILQCQYYLIRIYRYMMYRRSGNFRAKKFSYNKFSRKKIFVGRTPYRISVNSVH